MPQKKGKGNILKGEKGEKRKEGDKPEEAKGPMFTEVERTFLELQLAEANRKVARLRTTVEELELRNEEIKKAYDKLDEDRADIIAHLKRVLNNKNGEINELKEHVKTLEEARLVETAEHKKNVAEVEKNFKVMKEQLTSECKLLTSKLNTMEEFRITRDILMAKFEKQERQLKEQEMIYKRKIYEIEKKFVIGKDKLKKEMENRLMQLAQDFQDNTGLRIAATTHRVIRENIAINNELEKILASQAKLVNQNEKYKEKEDAAKLAKELAEEERDLAIKKSIAQLKVIDQLTTITQNVKKDKALMAVQNDNIDQLKAKIQQLSKENENLILKVRILEQNLHGKMNEQSKSILYASKISKENKKMKMILREAVISIQSALRLDEWATKDADRGTMDRETLLLRLLKIVSQYRDTIRAESTETLVSFEKVYEKGDLGFIPKTTKSQKSTLSIAPSIMTSGDSQESFKCSSESSSMSDLGSIKTIPSMHIIPVSTEPQRPAKESFQSFITSTKSNTSDSNQASDEDDMNDIDKQLEQSKLEVQQAFLKDFLAQRRPSKLFEIESVHEETKEVVEGGEGEAMGEAEKEETEDIVNGETVGEEVAEGEEINVSDDVEVILEEHQEE
ncbi:cilia- and flagella-associated protein 157-like [Cydia splendana]|uniref:cilia- and flagella-associated protein 157-like n=1 Tax=Cydia splendana TaxID=1100963 RepID=UPI0028F4A470